MTVTEKELAAMWDRHQTDAAFNADHHDPRSYMGVALADRGRLLAHLRELRTGEKAKADPTPTTASGWRAWMIENGLGAFVTWPEAASGAEPDCKIYGEFGAKACREGEVCDCKRLDQPKPQPTFDGLLNRAWEEVCKPDDLRCPTFPDRWAAPGAPASWGVTLKAVVFRAMRLAIQEIDRPAPAKQEKAA